MCIRAVERMGGWPRQIGWRVYVLSLTIITIIFVHSGLQPAFYNTMEWVHFMMPHRRKQFTNLPQQGMHHAFIHLFFLFMYNFLCE